MSEHSNEVAHGSFWGLAGSMVLKVISFAYAIYIARAFSQENIGLFYLSLSVITLIGFWRNLGLPVALQRYVPYLESKNEGGKIVSLLKLSFVASAIAGGLLFLILFALADPISTIYKNAGLAEGLRMLAIFALLENIFGITTGYLQGMREIKACQFMSNTQTIIKFILTVVLFTFFGATLFTLSAAFVLSYVVVLLIGLYFLLRKIPKTSFGETMGNTELIREVVPFGITLTIVQMFWVLVASTDRILLGYFGNSIETVAIYSIASQLALTLIVFPGAVGTILLPVISRLIGKDDRDAANHTVQTAQRWMMFILIPLALATMAFAKEMLTVFYGSSYQAGATAMSIFILGLMFSIISFPITLALASMRLVRLELYVATACMIVNVILNILFIPQFGMVGAATANAIAFLLSTLMFEYYGRKYLNYHTPFDICKLFLAGAAAFIVILLLKPFAAEVIVMVPAFGVGEFAVYSSKFVYLIMLGIVGCVGLVVFGIAGFLLHVIKQEDSEIVISTAKRIGVPPTALTLLEKIFSKE